MELIVFYVCGFDVFLVCDLVYFFGINIGVINGSFGFWFNVFIIDRKNWLFDVVGRNWNLNWKVSIYR